MSCRHCCFSIWKRHHISAYSAVVVYRWSAAFQPALEAASAGANCRLCSLFVVVLSVLVVIVLVVLVGDRPNIVTEVGSRHLVGVQHAGQESVTAVRGQLGRSTGSCLEAACGGTERALDRASIRVGIGEPEVHVELL